MVPLVSASRLYTVARLSPHIEQTPEGYLLCRDVAITRSGELIYDSAEVPEVKPGNDGRVRIRRTVDDIHDPDTIASFEGKPITLGHPQDMVGPGNWRELSNGVARNVRPGVGDDADKLMADLLITDFEAVQYVLRCKDEGRLPHVSCGYDAAFEDIGGGVGRQRKIRGNHVALVTFGRAGGACAVKDEGVSRRVYDEALPQEDDVKNPGFKDRFLALIGARPTGEALSAEVVATVLDEALKDGGVLDAPPPMPPAAHPAPAPGGAPAAPAAPAADPMAAKLDAILAALAKLIEMQGGGAPAAPATPAGGGVDDADPMHPACDAETISHAEILAPGCAKDGTAAEVMNRALSQFAATPDGREVLAGILGSRALDSVADDGRAMLLASAAAVVAAKRSEVVADAVPKKTADAATKKAPPTAEELTEIHRKARAERAAA